MTMYIAGTQEERSCEGLGCDNCPYQAIRVPILGCELEHGTTYVHFAGDLWSLVDHERGRKISNWLEDEWTADPEGDLDIRFYGTGSCRYLVNQINGLDEVLRESLTDYNFRVTVETATIIREQHPCLVDSWTGDVTEVYTLANRVHEVGLLLVLLEMALKYNRPICVGWCRSLPPDWI